MRTAFIGGGVMAEAMLARALTGNILSSPQVCVAEPIDTRQQYLANTYGVAVTTDNRAAADGAQLVVLSVKPQQLSHVFDDLSGSLGPGQTVLSIVAGVPMRKLVDGLRHDEVIRVMPNTPARIGAGMSVWTAAPSVTPAAREGAAALLGAMGRQWQAPDEGYLDMATAVSGSGPAYVFMFIEALTEAGVYLGMPRDMAGTLAVETVAGSGLLAKETQENPALLREMVTSPGGTTAEGLRELERGNLRAVVLEAVVAAYRKAKLLGENT
ncbi:MAG: pyrroline-5-carboxylate reductase [Dehalococcoidia bacterium]